MKRLLLPFLLLALLGTASAQERYFLYGGGNYSPEESVVLSSWLNDRPATDLVLYRVNNPEAVPDLGGPREFDLASELDLTEFLHREVIPTGQNSESRIDLGPLPIGMYLAQLGPAESGSAVIVLVTDLALVSKWDGSSLLLYTSDAVTGEPVAAELLVGRGENMTRVEGSADGVSIVDQPREPGNGDPVPVAARRGDSWAFSDNYWNRWSADLPSTYLVTDRPVYRPGDEVEIKGTIRTRRSLAPVADTIVTLQIEDADNSSLLDTELTTDGYGSFSVSLPLADNAPLGYYSISVQTEGHNGWGSFRVAEYELPEYEVSVNAELDYAIQGQTADFTVAAEYLFGGPVSGGTVSYVVMSEPYSRFAWRSEYGFYSSFSSTYGGSVIERGELTLGPDGQVRIPVRLQPQDRDYRLTLQAQVTDEASDAINGSASMIAYRAGMVLGIETGRYARHVDETVTVTVTAQDLEGNPISTDFELSSQHIRWVEGTGRVSEPGPVVSGTTDTSGTATVELDLDRSGSWELLVAARDDEGRLTDTLQSIWLFGGEAIYRNYEYLEVQADKDEYRIGETARFVIDSPVADGWALITREGSTLTTWELVRYSGNTLTHELTVTDDDLPNSHLGVVVVGNNEIYSAEVSYHINPGERFLDVQLDFPQDEFEPGSSTELTVTVLDHEGNPVRAQLTLGLVDEAVYMIQPEQAQDIRAFFYSWRGNVVSTALSSYMYFSQINPAPAAREAMDEAVFGQAKDMARAGSEELEEARLREDFRQTVLWLPDVETDAAGQATVEVSFPDNLTRWRLTARAISLDDHVGQATTQVTTTLPVLARLTMPGYLVRGDETRLRVIGQNNLDEDLPAEITLGVRGLQLAGEGETSVTLPASGRATFDVQAEASEVGTASVETEVLTRVASDALRLPLQVVPHGITRELVWASEGTGDWEFTLPDTATPGSFTGTVELTPSFLGAVSPSLEWMLRVPAFYTEQLVSQLLAAVAADEAGMELPDAVPDIDAFVREGLEQLYRLQHPDGGFGFWRFDTSDPLVSAYVLTALQELQASDHTVRDWSLNRLVGFVKGAASKTKFQVHSDLPEAEQIAMATDARAYMWLALARAGEEVWQLSEVAGDPNLSNYGLALSVLALASMGSDTEAQLYLDELLSRQVSRDAVAYWESGAPRYSWSDDRVETTALALQALAELRPDHDSLPRVVNWLMLERSGAGWYSGKDTSAVIRAALLLEQQEAPVAGDEAADGEPVPARLLLNGIVIEEFELTGEPVTVDLTGLAARGRNRLHIEVPEEETLYASALLSFMDEQEFREPEATGISVTRTFELLTPVWDEAEQHIVYERTPADTFAEGDFVVASVTVEPEGPVRYVQVREPLPAGFTVIEEDRSFRLAGVDSRYGGDYRGWNYWYDARLIRQRSIDYWFVRLSEPVTFTYIMRADHPGEFAALPSAVSLLYERDITAYSAAERLIIEQAEPAADNSNE